MNSLFRVIAIAALFLFATAQADAQPQSRERLRGKNSININNPEFFKSDEARRIGDQILAYQRVTGGWPKNIDMAKPMNDEEMAKVLKQKERRDDSTIDNNATTMQMRYLARLYKATNDEKYRDAFLRGLEFIMSGQYENGGWPQFWPDPKGYQIHITYNDGAIGNILELYQQIIDGKAPYDGKLIDGDTKKQLETAFTKGIDIILKTQIVVNGEPTVWCQQHDRETLKPAHARAYELPSFCSQESAQLLRLLMSLPNPDERIKRAVRGAMKWFDTYKITGYRYVRENFRGKDSGKPTRLEKDSTAGPLWARFYDLERCEPYVCDRDGVPRRHLHQIGRERRNGYAWYTDRARELYPLYEAWADKYDKANKLNLSLSSKGANETGLIDMFRKPEKDMTQFDAIVNPGEKIQSAIEKAPANPTEPFRIFIRNGIYREKVIIDRPNIVLVGEDRDSTRIILAETMKTRTIKEYNGKEVGNGVIVIQEGADDCVISGLTVYNNYGTTVENTTTHQMAIFGRATRTIVINSNVWADGNDALSLWARGGNGMYYHADLFLRCPGVDFLCPRGWCYATRCQFYGDGRAIIWHDGRGDIDKKLVITESTFDAKRPTVLGRYHHDSQFYLLYCTFSENILDANIHYAYSDKVLDPCPWGLRTYYHGCRREGGHSGWMKDNLQESAEKPVFHAVTAQWTFKGKWNPEKRIKELWGVLAY